MSRGVSREPPEDSTGEHERDVAGAGLIDQMARRRGRPGPRRWGCRAVSSATVGGRGPAYPRTARSHSPNLSDPAGAQSSQSSTMPVTLCKAMYFSAVMKVSSSRGSCTSRLHPHCSHASGIHWRGSELVVMSASSQPAVACPFGRIGQIPPSLVCIPLERIFMLSCWPLCRICVFVET
jgi:hypothetical protein